MSKIIEAGNLLFAARSCIECISLAASGLDEDTYPIQGVAEIAIAKIDEACALLREYRESGDAPVTDAPDAEPKVGSAETTPPVRALRTS